MSDVLSYMNIPGVRIRNSSSIVDGETFDDITDWGGTFIEHARAALLTLVLKERGKQLVDSVCIWVGKSGRDITIEPAAGFEGQNGPGWSEELFLLRWTPDQHPQTSDDLDQLNAIPPFIILGHELIHALHSLSGSTKYVGNFSHDKAIEEARTIGLGPWKDTGLTENGLRAEWGLPLRTTFSGASPERLLTGTPYAV